jgi:hypothetical protein
VPKTVKYSEYEHLTKWEHELHQKFADIYDIGGTKVAFGVDKQFKAAHPLVKALPRNPYAIANIDPTSAKGVQLANDYVHAIFANIQEKGAATQVDALLYAMTKGDMKAGLEFNRLAGLGRRLKPKQSKPSEYMSYMQQNFPYSIQGLKRTRIGEFNPKDLYLVHETAHKPQFDKFGNLILGPTSNFQTFFPDVQSISQRVKLHMDNFAARDLDPIPYALEERNIRQQIIQYAKDQGDQIIGDKIIGKGMDYYRDTIHFALNHLVVGHGQRQSLSEGYVIVANLMDTLKANPGSLSNLYAVDSWLTPKAGKGLTIPTGSFDILPTGQGAADEVARLIDKKVYPRDMYQSRPEGSPSASIPGGVHGTESVEWATYIRRLSKALGVGSSAHFESASQRVSAIKNYSLFDSLPSDWEDLAPNEIARLFYKRNIFTGILNKVKNLKPSIMANGGLIPGFANGGVVPGSGSQGFPAMLHGGEYVVNSSAVKNIGIAALQAMNNMRFNTPKAPTYAGPVNGQSTSTSTTHIYVENFIGEKQWFESMMKDYNVTVAPQNQKAAGLNNTTISTYSGINRGL